MSRRQPNYAERVMLRFACGYCSALVGEWCHTTATARYPATYLHGSRFWAATDARLLPLSEVSA